jgi:polysaccharide pyruvyl transferase WcaK-like protein
MSASARPVRAGILTYHFSENFGAVLQAYALQRWLQQQGLQVCLINYHPAYVEDGSEIKQLLNPRNLKANLKALYLKTLALKTRVFGLNAQSRQFQAFKARFLNIDGPRYASADHLNHAVIGQQLLVAGSDQIWNPSGQTGLDPAYFLAFDCDKAIRRISYAASFGKEYLEPEYHAEAEVLLKQLSAVSVREESGVAIVQQVSGLVAQCVPDPTLLHREYSTLLATSTQTRSGHVFCYALRTGAGVREVAQALSRHVAGPIVSPYNAHRRWRQIGQTVQVGPQDWLKLLKDAAYVVTNSFHATVFAVIFEKPFIAVGLPGSKASLNARVRNLLEKLQLSHRFLPAENAGQAQALIAEPIDWVAVRARREALQQVGERYLLEQLAALKP